MVEAILADHIKPTPPVLPPNLETQSDSENTEEKSFWSETLGDTGLTVGLISLLLFLRIFAVAEWTWDTAAELADSFNFDDAVSILLGTLFERPQLMGAFLVFLLPLAIFRDYWLAKHKTTKGRAKTWFIIVALLITIYVLVRSFQLWWVPITAGLLTLVLIGLTTVVRLRGWNRSLARVGHHLGALIALSFLFLAVTVDTPWMALEKMEIVTTTEEGVLEEENLYAYVLDASPGFLKVMTIDREVLIFPDSSVTSRTIVDDYDLPEGG